MNIPSREECLSILAKNNTPSNIIEHCKAVCDIAEEIVDKLTEKGLKVNKDLVIAAALLHDIERAKDNHVSVGCELIKSMGFPEVAEVMRKHTYLEVNGKEIGPETIEEKIVFYADKRIRNNKKVSLDERFDDLTKRYDEDFTSYKEFTKKIEKELME